jgi:hypothetical protein
MTYTEIKILNANMMHVLKNIKNIQDVIDHRTDFMNREVRIHLKDKIEDIAKRLGCEVKTRVREGREFPIEKSFTYCRVTVFQLEKAQ